MSESEQLQQARSFIFANQKEKAAPILWSLYKSNNQDIKLDAALSLLVIMDHLTENQKLLEVTQEAIKTAFNLKRDDVRAYLLTKKATLLFSDFSFLGYRQRNLTLSADVFDWIDFSLEKDKKEFEAISAKRDQLEKEVNQLEIEATNIAELTGNHYLRGHIFMGLAELYFSKFLSQQLDLSSGGRVPSMIANFYLIRRWGLDKFVIYNKENRKKLRESKKSSIDFFKKAISEFETANLVSDLAYALHNLAVKFALIFSFRKAKKYLNLAKRLAKNNNDAILSAKIEELERQIKDKNKHPRNYVEEFGLDLP